MCNNHAWTQQTYKDFDKLFLNKFRMFANKLFAFVSSHRHVFTQIGHFWALAQMLEISSGYLQDLRDLSPFAFAPPPPPSPNRLIRPNQYLKFR